MSGDPEIDAMSAVATALAGLEPDTQARILTWAAERYGLQTALGARRVPVDRGARDGTIGAGGAEDDAADALDEAAVMAAVADETGVPVAKLERVFHLDDGAVKLLGSSSKYGSTTTDQARAVAQVVTVVRRVGMGHPDTPFEVIKDACESKHCYDHKNFGSHHLGKLDGFVVKGEKRNRRLEAKGSGIAGFAAVIDKILGES